VGITVGRVGMAPIMMSAKIPDVLLASISVSCSHGPKLLLALEWSMVSSATLAIDLAFWLIVKRISIMSI
jgi:hypothetical protein